jgi:hypothetical protein
LLIRTPEAAMDGDRAAFEVSAADSATVASRVVAKLRSIAEPLASWPKTRLGKQMKRQEIERRRLWIVLVRPVFSCTVAAGSMDSRPHRAGIADD